MALSTSTSKACAVAKFLEQPRIMQQSWKHRLPDFPTVSCRNRRVGAGARDQWHSDDECIAVSNLADGAAYLGLIEDYLCQ
jgi:hypothetical protein